MVRGCGAKHIGKSKCTKHHAVGASFEVPMFKNGTALGAKHICKSKCAKHHMFGPLSKGQMSKNGTALWREAHL